VVVITLARLGIAAGQRAGLTGVWVPADAWAKCPRCRPADRPQPAKIASIGVKVDAKGVSRHGFALNVETDPQYWDGIIPCGLDQVNMVNIADLLPAAPPMDQVGAAVLEAFAQVFQCAILPASHLQSGT
jgi:lipoyl(octanoyl) transferase